MVAGTIRRFLEHFGEEIEMVVFVTDSQEVNWVVVVAGHWLYFIALSLSLSTVMVQHHNVPVLPPEQGGGRLCDQGPAVGPGRQIWGAYHSGKEDQDCQYSPRKG